MIYCVVPEELESELYERMKAYYADDSGVQVIIDRRHSERRDDGPADGNGTHRRELRDRRRARVPGEFPQLDPE